MKNLTRFSLVLLLLCAVSLPASAARKRKATAKLINQSNWVIYHVYLSPVSEDTWGPDLLDDEVLSKGDSLTLTNIPCNSYDVKIVDEDGDECVVEEVDLCNDHSYWKLTDKDLLECEGY